MKNTSDNKHTPGPWHCANSGRGRIYKTWSIYCRNSAGFVDKLATVETIEGQGGPEREYATARLIASAPDLLAALEALLHADSVICEGKESKSDQAMIRIAAIDNARSAIAKARGEA